MLDDLLILAVVIGLAYWSGFRVGQMVTLHRIISRLLEGDPELDQAIARARKDLAQSPPADVSSQSARQIRVEREGDQLYLYDRNSGQFLAQGSSLEQALNRVGEQFPNQFFTGHLTADDVKKLGIDREQFNQ